MDFEGKKVVVTGGSSGIGAALINSFAASGAKTCCIDLREPDDRTPPPNLYLACDVSNEAALKEAIAQAGDGLGGLDIYVSNAGVLSKGETEDGLGANDDWALCWSVNVMAHVYAARAVLPRMRAQGHGRFVIVASAAGLLNQIGDPAYSATKHAAVSFAESLAITHGSDGIGVTLVCPQYVATPLIGLQDADAETSDTLLSADEVADCTLKAIAGNRFLVLPHPEVHAYALSRARDHDRWIGGMTRLRQKAITTFGDARPDRFFRLL
ncbi:MAG: SDR family oxidoreductase [Roseobacter sp.]|jgi:NAD(P)-dependent dehydrogenase (short-subunit alcohol dehydrogenase family)